MERTFIEQLRAGTSIDQSFLVKAKSRRQKRTGEPFLTFLLIDRTGEIVGNLWEGFGEDEASIEAGDFVQVTAAVLSFQGSPQLNIQRIRKLSPEEIRREDFYPSTTKDTGEMSEYLRTVASSLENPYLRALVRSFLEDDAFMACFRQSPAAKGLHHAYVGGLLEHTASVLKVCEAILEHYRGVRRISCWRGPSCTMWGK
jgi:3'-5' exoribonuclease